MNVTTSYPGTVWALKLPDIRNLGMSLTIIPMVWMDLFQLLSLAMKFRVDTGDGENSEQLSWTALNHFTDIILLLKDGMQKGPQCNILEFPVRWVYMAILC